jgi:hypothetical protein
VGRANVLYSFNLVLLCTKFGFSVLFRSPSICKNFVILECIRIIQVKRMRWEVHVACMREA